MDKRATRGFEEFPPVLGSSFGTFGRLIFDEVRFSSNLDIAWNPSRNPGSEGGIISIPVAGHRDRCRVWTRIQWHTSGNKLFFNIRFFSNLTPLW